VCDMSMTWMYYECYCDASATKDWDHGVTSVWQKHGMTAT